jgi:hypothetical protein
MTKASCSEGSVGLSADPRQSAPYSEELVAGRFVAHTPWDG